MPDPNHAAPEVRPPLPFAELEKCFPTSNVKPDEMTALHSPGRVPQPGGTAPSLAACGPAFGAPHWDGSDPAGRTILVHCGPALSECIQWVRYVLLLTGRRADVVLACPPTLIRLFGRLPGVRVVGQGEPLPPADAHVALGDLPVLFGTTAATIPTFASYLRPAPMLASAWRERLRPLRPGNRRPHLVGIAADAGGWAFRELQACITSTNPAAHVVSISAGVATSTGSNPAAGSLMGEVAYTLDDLADTAAVLAQLDVVIAADPVVAHLAGASGRPVWTLVPAGAEGCWSVGDDTPWYPSMRLFRQAVAGDWSDVSAAVTQSLRDRLAAATATAA